MCVCVCVCVCVWCLCVCVCVCVCVCPFSLFFFISISVLSKLFAVVPIKLVKLPVEFTLTRTSSVSGSSECAVCAHWLAYVLKASDKQTSFFSRT